MDTYDLIVIGTGTGAQVAASRIRRAGWSVAVIDHRPFGGTCTLRGCDPKKVLVGVTDALDHARRLAGQGLTGDVKVDWPALMRRKRSFTDPIPANRAQSFAEAGITAIQGRAAFSEP